MRTPLLLEVPKSSPTRKERLHAFMQRNAIESHSTAAKSEPGFPKWCALHLPTGRQFGYGVTATSDLFDCVGKVGRLLDESGVMGYGDTEAEAVEATCKAVGIPFEP